MSVTPAAATFVSLNSGTKVISVQSNSMLDLDSTGTPYSITLTVSFTNYPSRSSTQSFNVYLVDPCPSAVLSLPTTLSNISITALISSVNFNSQTFSPATDNVALPGTTDVCGPRTYTVTVSGAPHNFMSILQPVSGFLFNDTWTLIANATQTSDIGTWTTVTLTA
jgi:hypothetical protein